MNEYVTAWERQQLTVLQTVCNSMGETAADSSTDSAGTGLDWSGTDCVTGS